MIIRQLKKIAKFGWFVPGFLLWAAFPPMGEKTDVLFALAPLLWLSRQGEVRQSVNGWLKSGVFFWVATLSWMPAIVKNGGPWPLVVLGWSALAAYCAAFFVAFGWLSARYWGWAHGSTARHFLGVLLVEPLLWCGLELVRSRFLGGFAWNQLGVVAANGGFGAPASWGGVYLLSAVIVLINGTIAGIAERLIASMKRQPVSPLRTIETILAFGIVFGIYELPKVVGEGVEEQRAQERHLKVALIQRNFPCVFQTREENPYKVYGKLLENVADLRPELVVLPESALCEFGPADQQGAVRFAEWVARQTGADLLTGSTRTEEGKTYNSAVLYTNCHEKAELQFYDKVHLVPFGEFIPGDKWFPVLQRLAPVGSCTPGELKLLELPSGIKVGVAICFEDTDSAQLRRLARMGAQALVFITNDSWFSRSNECVQHAWQATARAIETGLPVVRVGNSGVTGTISPAGVTSWLMDGRARPLVDRRGTMFDRIAVGRGGGETPYCRFGDWPLAIAFVLLILAMILIQYAHHYEKRRYLSM